MLQKLRRRKAKHKTLGLGTLAGNPQLSSSDAGKKQRRFVYQLPQDVLIALFEEACRQTSRAWTDWNTYIDNPGPRTYHHVELPSRPKHDRCFVTLMRLTHVCSYWREVALGAALLWNRINLPCRDAKLLDLHIERSLDADLDVSVHYFRDENLNPQLDTFLLRYMHRIRRLYIDLPYHRALLLPDCDAPSLTGLFVKARWQSSPLRASSIKMPSHAPNLRQLSFISVKPTIPFSALALVTHLCIMISTPYTTSNDAYTEYPKLMEILSHCQGLVEMDIDFVSREIIPLNTVYRIYFPNLRLIRLRNMTYHPSYYPLTYIRAPALRSLRVDNRVVTLPPVSELLPTSLVDLASLGVKAARIIHSSSQSPHCFLLYSDVGLQNEVFMCTLEAIPKVVRNFFCEVVQNHSLISIESLFIHLCQSNDQYISTHDLDFQYFKSLQSIRSIQIEGIRFTRANSLGYKLFKTITSSDRESQRRNNTIFLPELEKLTVAHKVSDHVLPSARAVSILAYDELLAFLRYRVHHGKTLKELHVHRKVVEGEWYSWNTQELTSFVGALQFFD